jgi:putative oligomerization/nucleic acid binding protein/uncharacterized protein DUF3824
MPGLIRGVARTAVVAGTATAVSNRVSRRQAGRWAAQEQQEYEHDQYVQQQYAQQQYAQQPYPPPQPQPEPAPAAPAGGDMTVALAQLQQLAQLKDQGVLTDEEFQQQKARLLGT